MAATAGITYYHNYNGRLRYTSSNKQLKSEVIHRRIEILGSYYFGFANPRSLVLDHARDGVPISPLFIKVTHAAVRQLAEYSSA
jgi:hypothetical protein